MVQTLGAGQTFDGRPVLAGIDLDIRRGEVVAIVGGSGCGKTVLLNHILGLIDGDSGRVRIVDHARAEAPLVDLATLDERARDGVHAHWGVVFQRNALFSGTVFENIALWLREVRHLDDAAIGEIAGRVLAAVELPTDDAFLATDTASLSGGMAKRLAVARALSMDPIVIFYDEPTSGLDPTNAGRIQDLICAAHFEPASDRVSRTTVIITHDKDLLSRLQPRIVMLHDGGISFDGRFEDFAAANSPIIRPYFDLMPILHQRPGDAGRAGPDP
ncbi:MAG: ATP-binding cassette domain-containing protein [Alphaproteobacteria bacterium]|nr:ATP-binding cassette domain-containing protein [Alphaproteobacteria bacterium]